MSPAPAADDAQGDAPVTSVGKARARPVRWTDVYLVCKDCGKRSSGPRKLKPKALAKLVRKEASRLDGRVRVVMTECLGLCPKRAITVARVGPQARPMLVAVASRKRVAGAVVALHSTDV